MDVRWTSTKQRVVCFTGIYQICFLFTWDSLCKIHYRLWKSTLFSTFLRMSNGVLWLWKTWVFIERAYSFGFPSKKSEYILRKTLLYLSLNYSWLVKLFIDLLCLFLLNIQTFLFSWLVVTLCGKAVHVSLINFAFTYALTILLVESAFSLKSKHLNIHNQPN